MACFICKREYNISSFKTAFLLKDGFLSSSWQETTEGLPPRKYYTITDKGREYLEAMLQEWGNLLTAVKGIEGE